MKDMLDPQHGQLLPAKRNSSVIIFRAPIFHMFIICLIGIAVYANTLHAPFQFDDSSYINHENMRLNPSDFLDAAKLTQGVVMSDNFKAGLLNRRFGFITFILNYKLHGLSVTGYHLVNIFIHIVTALLVYALINRLWHTPFINNCIQSHEEERELLSRWTAFFGAALFVAHPVNTQAVTYIVQRYASLATMLYLLALLIYLSAALGCKRGLSVVLYVIALIATIMAMFTKEISFTLPAVMFLCDRLFLQRKLRQTLLAVTPFLLTMVIIPWNLIQAKTLLVSTSGRLAGSFSLLSGNATLSRYDYFVTELRVIVTYIRLLLFPVNQNLDYDYPAYTSLLSPTVLASLFMLLSIASVGFVMLRISAVRSDRLAALYRLAAFGIFWFFMTLSVESSFQPLENVIYEHRLYLPFFGFALTIVCAVALLWSQIKVTSPESARFIPVASLLAVLVLCSFATIRNALWQDDIALWEDVVRKSPQKGRVHINLGNAYLDKKRLDMAQQQFLVASQLDPDNWKAYFGIARICEEKQQYTEALLNYNKCIALEPASAAVQVILGNLYLKLGMTDKAYDLYMNMISMNKNNFEANYNLGLVCAQRRLYSEAKQYYRKALELAPEKTYIFVDIGKINQFQGNLQEAIVAYRAAISGDIRNFDVHYNLGLVYDSLQEYAKAIDQYQQAQALRKDYVPLYNNLGVTYFKLGQLYNSLESFKKVLQHDPQNIKARSSIQLITTKLRSSR